MGWLIEWNSKDVIRVDVAKLREVWAAVDAFIIKI